ncbi:MAG: hypothetical protein K2X68_11325 [Novosphingobium sp.]|nr:hypothetical protein [Novosphingobium sp.]
MRAAEFASIGLIGLSALLLYGVAYSEALQLGYGFVFVLFYLPLEALLGNGALFKAIGQIVWWLVPALPGLFGIVMLLKPRRADA